MKKINKKYNLILLKKEGKIAFDKAFSLVELLVVITIIAIISASWLMYFTDFANNLKIRNAIYEIKGDLEGLDNKINNKKLFDYEIYFEINSLYYYDYKNNFDLNYRQKLVSLDSNTWIWNIKIDWASSWTWRIKYYRDYKFKKEEEISYNWTFSWNFKKYKNNLIEWYFLWEKLNSIDINYFSINNIDLETQDYIVLVWINTKQDKSGASYNKIIIKNILWKKEFYDNSLNEIATEKIYLFFENNIWKVESLKISK